MVQPKRLDTPWQRAEWRMFGISDSKLFVECSWTAMFFRRITGASTSDNSFLIMSCINAVSASA